MERIRVKRERIKLENGKTVFAPGHSGGRPKGSKNKTSQILKEATILAASQVGEDDFGKDGLTGYLRRIAREEPKSMVMLLAKILPLQITGANGGPVDIHSYQTVDQVIAKLIDRGIPVPEYLKHSNVIDLKAKRIERSETTNG